MIELPVQRSQLRPWLVCESGSRWLTASRRFVPAMMPPPLSASIIPVMPDRITAAISGHRQAVIVWSIQSDDLVDRVDRIRAVSIASPHVLQIAAVTDLSAPQRTVLSELRVSVMMRHVEELPRWQRLIQGYFADSLKHLD
ncbi:hypothetical protein K227x_64880 [Rubripirellula lacrimiformis]|uniref:Uncharacterized protein n=1 Tax=Rubripirellula lacrimiformis TaxID=1930273 RepID=A0A517NLQ1_9BACT|nr:hypothetical protein [Rubripirellula lacrimiformis]QDT08058.1 hypothetical protein K227x_64880 [Rubripirellula lacrimiformis]